MSPYLLIIFLLVGIAVGFYFTKKGGTPQGFFGKRSVEKEGNKTKILAEFASKGKITNDDVEKLLGVSDATATRYLEELEKEGVIKQMGDTGQGVYYILV